MKPFIATTLTTTTTVLLLTTIIQPVSSKWEYIPPLYACSPKINGCSAENHECLANPNHPQSTTDETCLACGKDQKYWPCDVDGLCYCWDKSRPKIPPAPSTRTFQGGQGLNVSDVDPCALLTPDVFEELAPAAQAPYSYAGFCTAVRKYNENHIGEGVFNMGTPEQQRAELAAFFGNALHESDEFRAGREYLMCADRIEMGGEVYCRPCDAGSFDWDLMECPSGASLASEGRAFNSYCQSNLLPPEGCQCDDVYERSEHGPMAGHVKANQVYFGRGSIQLSWNYNYIRASVALTGAPQTFCQRPDLVATNEEYAWGAGLFYWMENVKNDKTCHQSVLLNGEFGETLDNINGGLECPADDHGWHGKAIILRLNRYCRAATALNVRNLLSLEGCMDMEKRMRQCLGDGTCRDCYAWEEQFMELDDEENDNSAVDDGNGNGGKKKNKDKDKDKDKNEQDDKSTSGNSNADKKKKKDKDKKKDNDKNKQEVSAATVEQDDTVDSTIKEDTPKPPTLSPTAEPTYQPDTPYPTESPTDSPTEESSAFCSGLPCPVPYSVQLTVDFCRSSSGICGTGRQYCNSESTWTSSCSHDDDTPVPTTYYPTTAGPSRSPVNIVVKPASITAEKQPIVAARPPTSSSHASKFAFMTHGKGRYSSAAASSNNGAVTVARREPDTASPVESPKISSASQFGGMMNWANTKLEYPPSESPVVATGPPVGAMSERPTSPPTRLPTKKPVKVINIAEAFDSESKDVEEAGESLVEQSTAINEARSKNEINESDADTPPVSLPATVSVEATAASYYTKLDDDSFLFYPMDDVFISRSSPSSNFGSEPSIVIDMLEGDATLLRFDLSALGDNTIQKATLRLTATLDEDGASNAAGVYYIQPTVNGWTEGSVTYNNAPKAGGSLFASVVSLISSEDASNNNRYELDVTDAAANHVISFRVIGTDRVRHEFASKESSQANDAPSLLVKLESTESTVDTTITKLPVKPNSNGVKGKTTVAKVTGGSANDSDPLLSRSSSGSISGHIWLDRNYDGIKETNEPGLRGILVDLYLCDDDTWLEGTRTAPGGEYMFQELDAEGEYYVIITTASPEYGFSKKVAVESGGNARVSDVDPDTGRGDCIELSPTDAMASVNAGVVKKSQPQISTTETLVELTTIPESPVVGISSESDGENDDSSTTNYNCRGRACSEGECRSKYNFCGVGEEYCNEDSQWTDECGTPAPIDPPSAAPTTGWPTFLHDPNIHCVGEPCYDEGDGTWCRSEIGYCGSGPLYCNADSSWMPDCDVGAGDGTSAPPTKSPALEQKSMATDSSPPTIVGGGEEGQPVVDLHTVGLGGPSPAKDYAMFSSFALPTLSEIVTPKGTDIGATPRLHSTSATKNRDDEQSLSFQTDVSSLAIKESSSTESEGQIATKKPLDSNVAEEDKPWYIRYSDVIPASASRNGGSQSIPARFDILVPAAIFLLGFL